MASARRDLARVDRHDPEVAVRHVFWLRAGVIGGRSGPNLEPWDPRELAAGGIGAVLSLNDAALVRADELARAGLDHRWVPLSDSAPPRPCDLETCVEALPRALSFALGAIARDRSVLVHCRSGKDRTGLFLAYYLRETEGMSVDEAIRAVRSVRPIALSADGWEVFALQVLDELGSPGR